MAKIVSTHQINCPNCNAIGIVRVWSCGCQDVTHSDHDDDCNYIANFFFIDFEEECGEPGSPKEH